MCHCMPILDNHSIMWPHRSSQLGGRSQVSVIITYYPDVAPCFIFYPGISDVMSYVRPRPCGQMTSSITELPIRNDAHVKLRG